MAKKPGSIWIDSGDHSLRFVDHLSVEYKYTGTLVDTPAGAKPGSIYVDTTAHEIWWIAGNGSRYKLIGKVDLGVVAAKAGSVWIDISRFHFIASNLHKYYHHDDVAFSDTLPHTDGGPHVNIAGHNDHQDSGAHNDGHTDAPHADSHTDYHGNTTWPHGDIDFADHTDFGHADVPHTDTPYNHLDQHDDIAHVNDAHRDTHNDHVDHTDGAHYDGAGPHTDTFSDIAGHSDHTDSGGGVHVNVAHQDNPSIIGA